VLHVGGFAGGGFSPICSLDVLAFWHPLATYTCVGGTLTWNSANAYFELNLSTSVPEAELVVVTSMHMTADSPNVRSVVVQRVSNTQLRIEPVNGLASQAYDTGFSVLVYRRTGTQRTLATV